MDRAGTATTIEIDARPRGPEGPLAAHVVRGRPVLAHLLDAVEPSTRIVVQANSADAPLVARLVPESHRGRVSIALGAPEGERPTLRVDRLYDAARLRRAVRAGRSPRRAEIWRLDSPAGLAGAEAELTRRTTYQPIGRYWAIGPARWVARRLAPTPVRPNQVTLAAFAWMAGATWVVASGGPGWIAAAAMALALVLDTADGHLARLQGTTSDFGRWLDGLLDEVADLALHLAIAWAAFARSGEARWLAIAALYIGGKHLFAASSADWDRIRGEGATNQLDRHDSAGPRPAARLARFVRGLAHADVRWHLWIVLSAAGQLDAALIAYAAYYPLRTIAGIASKRRANADAHS